MSIFGWLATAWHWLAAQFATANAASTPDPVYAIMRAQNYAIGPMPTTGGIIHLVDETTLMHEAALIEQGVQNAQRLTISLALAWITGESRFDCQAINPNNQLAEPNESPLDAFKHADLGIGQFDGATLLAMPEFAGKSIEEIKAKAFDPNWAIPYFCTYADDLLGWANDTMSGDAAISAACKGDSRLLGIEAYNAGRTGAVRLARMGAPLTYAQSILARAASFEKVLA